MRKTALLALLAGSSLAAGSFITEFSTIGTADIRDGAVTGPKIASGAITDAKITSLDASKITAGTIATARLGSGSANSATFLRGDQTWATYTVGTVTSVGLALPAQFTISNSPVTSSGTLTGSWATQNANIVFAGPNTGSAAVPTFRSLVLADLPAIAASNLTNGTTGSNEVVLKTSPTLVTPVLGAATATTVNKYTLTTPATGSTLTIDDGFTLRATGNVTALSGSHTGTSSGTNTGDQTITLSGEVSGSGTGAITTTSADGYTTVVCTADQNNFTGSSPTVASTYLVVNTTANHVYSLTAFLIFSTDNATNDCAFKFQTGTGNMTGYGNCATQSTNLIASNVVITDNASTVTNNISVGGQGSADFPTCAFVTFSFRTVSSTTVTIYAGNAATGGGNVKIHKGSWLKYRDHS